MKGQAGERGPSQPARAKSSTHTHSGASVAQTLYVLVAVAVGCGSAVQLAMLGAMGRQRGAHEAAWISIVATIGGLSLVVVGRLAKGSLPNLPSPMNTAWPWVLVLLLASTAMALSVRGLPLYFAACGLFATTYLLAAGIAAPKIGASLFIGAATAGTLFGSAFLDHVGAFGGPVRETSLLRASGIAVVFLGVVMVRLAP